MLASVISAMGNRVNSCLVASRILSAVSAAAAARALMRYGRATFILIILTLNLEPSHTAPTP